MGLRRLDVASHYSAEELAKVKKKERPATCQNEAG